MYGALVSGAIGAIGSIFGSIGRNEALRKQQEAINRRKRENENWYNRRYNEDATQRADAQRLLTMTEEAIKRRNRAAAGRQAVMGGTDESVAAEKDANNKALADVTSQIAAAGEQRKDAIERQYLNRKERLDDAGLGLEGQKASGFDILGNAIGGASDGLFKGAMGEYLINKYKD